MAAQLESIDGIIRLSIARLATEFGMARETVTKRLQAAGVPADGKRNGHPVYRIRDACPALIDSAQSVDDEGNPDPRTLAPDKRKSWYQSELARLTVETNARNLIPAAEVEQEWAAAMKHIAQFLDTLGDRMERDCGLTPEQVKLVQDSADRLRSSLYEAIVADQAAA